jgi:hypothetical protein
MRAAACALLMVALAVIRPEGQTVRPDLYVGDKVTLGVPGIAQGEQGVMYHLADAILYLEEAGEYNTIILGLGIHAVQGSDKPYAGHPNLFRRRYARLLDTALGHGQRVIVVNIPWLNWIPEKTARAEKWNGIIQELAAARGVCVVDAWSILNDCGLACISGDGYHPNGRGYGLIGAGVRGCYPAVR